MNWTRYKLLIISGGISLIVSGGLIFWILSTRKQISEVDGQIQSLNSQQTQLASKKPYPSEKNFEQLKSEQSKVVEQRDQLLALIDEGQLEAEDVSRSSFGDYVRGDLVPGLREAAKASKKGGEHGVILSDPDFGMTEYLEGLLPETSKIPELLLEMKTIEHLSLLLMDSGISELNLVARKVEETQKGRRGPAMGLTELAGFDGGMVPPEDMMGDPNEAEEADQDPNAKLKKEKDRLFDYQDYRLEFKAYEDFLWETINNLVADPNQFVITELYVTNSNENLWPRYLEPVLGRDRSGRNPSRKRPSRPQPQLSEMEMMLRGGAMDGDFTGGADVQIEEVRIAGLVDRRINKVGGDLLNVVMTVRVYRLAEQSADETEEGI